MVHVEVSKLGEPRSCRPGALPDPGVSASGDDALDLRVVGQVVHGVFNVCAATMALNIEARSTEEFF